MWLLLAGIFFCSSSAFLWGVQGRWYLPFACTEQKRWEFSFSFCQHCLISHSWLVLDLLETLVIFCCWPYLEGFFFFFVIFFLFPFLYSFSSGLLEEFLVWSSLRLSCGTGMQLSITDNNSTLILSHCSNIPVMFENLMFPEFANCIIMLLNAFSFCLWPWCILMDTEIQVLVLIIVNSLVLTF